MGENIDVKVIKEGLQVIIPRYAEKDSSNVLQRAQDYINGLKQINEEIVHKNKMILDKSKEQIKKLTKIWVFYKINLYFCASLAIKRVPDSAAKL